ncbi:hypothetical protein L1I30_08170 [Gillisia sp. M10.2A]|uniref:3-oxoacyl-ACP synthase n=1 Tax=Gillisia lutea TaxID=2909668 RepID=A0ABS9EIF3_9FLAO|nr:hypothetical protein [Gillisia lutea]MCF4101639.1 hypothetical protein [Gillisia lutea]
MSRESVYITDFVSLKNNQIKHQQKLLYKADSFLELKSFLKESYKVIGLNYPKFHKMDDLCKLGLLASEVILKEKELKTDTAIVLSNASSSLQTDYKHQNSLQQHVSPAVFVYTLPNIILGEISIKYSLKSENVFFIEETFNAKLLNDYAQVLLQSGKASSVVCGWINLINDEYDVFLCLISRKGEIPLSVENLEQLYLFENE